MNQTSPHDDPSEPTFDWDMFLARQLEKFESSLQAREHGSSLQSEDLSGCPPNIASELEELQATLLKVESFLATSDSRNSSLRMNPDSEPSTFPLLHAGSDTNPVSDLQYKSQVYSDLRLGRFEIGHKLGEGTYGIVYLANDPRLKRFVALKIPRLDAAFRDDLRERFVREGESAARLTHPNIVTVFEAVSEGPISLIVSEYIPGPNLANWLMEHPGGVPAKQAARLVAGLAEGIAHAHARNVLHRDIKPSNILLAPKQSIAPSGGHAPDELDSFEPKLTDFGLAKLLEHQDATLSGVIVGTPAYMPPEQIAGKKGEVGTAADIYSLGMVLYELLTGANPYIRSSLSEVIHEVTRGSLPPFGSVPADLATICLKCLRPDPKERYGSAHELSDDLNRFLENRPIRARNVTWPEQFAKWCRRNPLLASTVCSTFLLLFSLAIGYRLHSYQLSVALNRATEMELIAEQKAREAEQKAQEADEQRNEVLRRSYNDDMQIAGKSWNDSNDDEALRRLERYLPNPGEKDFRTFPWWLMYRSIKESSKVLTRHEGGATAVAVQSRPSISVATGNHVLSMQNTGNFAMAWRVTERDGSLPSILAQWFTADSTPLGPPLFFSDGVVYDHRSPLIDSDSKGNSLIGWLDLNPDPDTTLHQINGQRFDPQGKKLGDAFLIDVTPRGGTPFEADIALGEDGGFVVAWTCKFSDNPEKHVYCQWFDSSGNPKGPSVRVNSIKVGTFTAPVVEMNVSGDTFITWIGHLNGEEGWCVWARSFSSGGVPFGEDFRVQSDLNAGALQPDLACDGKGEFTVAWCGLEQIFLRRFSAKGEPLGEDEQVSVKPSQVHQAPKITMNHIGETVVVWQAAQRDKSQHSIFGQRYDNTGKRFGDNFLIEQSDAAHLIEPVAGIDPNGNVVINHIKHSPGADIPHLESQRFDRANQRLGHPDKITGQLLATAGNDKTIRLFSAPNLAPIAELKGHTKGPIQTLQFFQQGNRNWLLSAADDGYARLWDLNTLKEIRSFQHSDWLPVARFIGKNAERIATGGADGIIRIWDPLTGNLEKELKGHTEEVRALCDHPDQDLLFSSSEDDTVRVWNWRTGEPDWRIPEGILKTAHFSWTSTLDLSPDGRRLIAGYRSGGVCLWNVAEGDDFGTIAVTFHVTEGIRRIRWTDDQCFLIGAGKSLSEYSLHFQEGQWKLNEGSQNFHGLKTKINDLTWTPEGQEMISADESGSVSFWPKRTIRGDIEGIEVPTRRVGGAGTFFNGQWMSLNRGEKVFVSPIRPGPCRFELVMQDIDPNGYHCPLPGGKGVMVSDEVKEEYLFSAYVAPPKYHTDPAPSPVWRVPVGNRRPDNGNCSPDGRLVAVCCDMTLHVIDSDSGKRVLEHKHPAAVSDTQFSPDGKTLFSTCADGKLRSWWTSDWAMSQERKVSSQALTGLSFSLDGKLIAIAGLDNTARVWEDMDRDPVATISLPVSSNRIAILDDGATLGVVLADSRVSFYNIADQSELLTVESHDGWRYDFSPDRSHLIGRDSNFTRSIFLWKGVRDTDGD